MGWSFFWQHPLRGNSTESWNAVMIPKQGPTSMPPGDLRVPWDRTALRSFGVPTTTVTTSTALTITSSAQLSTHDAGLLAWLLPLLAGISACTCLGAFGASALQ